MTRHPLDTLKALAAVVAPFAGALAVAYFLTH